MLTLCGDYTLLNVFLAIACDSLDQATALTEAEEAEKEVFLIEPELKPELKPEVLILFSYSDNGKRLKTCSTKMERLTLKKSRRKKCKHQI